MDTEKTDREQKRISFAGFVCWWRLPREAGQSPRQRFASITESIRQTLEQDLNQAGQPERKWKAVRIAAPGRHFMGFARR
jgi:hypothetical protein